MMEPDYGQKQALETRVLHADLLSGSMIGLMIGVALAGPVVSILRITLTTLSLHWTCVRAFGRLFSARQFPYGEKETGASLALRLNLSAGA
jgi:hypothetical protein